jgi:hypothetical protein
MMEKIIEESKQGESCTGKQTKNTKKLFIESYGCDEFSDSEIVASIPSLTDTILLKF